MHTSSTSSASRRRILGVFAKEPRLGQVKTRLAAETSADWAARVASAFLLDGVERLAQVDAHRVLAFAPEDARGYFSRLVGDRYTLLPQVEGDLGQRMAAFLGQHFQAGDESVVLVGTDSPTLPSALIAQAFAELEEADVVLGPATDGGYYLIGCARQVPPIFEGISWGSRNVLVQSIARLTDSACHLALLPPWYDVDTLDDWKMLQGHVGAMRRAGLDSGVPHTEQLLSSALP